MLVAGEATLAGVVDTTAVGAALVGGGVDEQATVVNRLAPKQKTSALLFIDCFLIPLAFKVIAHHRQGRQVGCDSNNFSMARERRV